jgi:hypothetical protein
MESSRIPSISALRQLDLSSSGGHEECDDKLATTGSLLEGVGMSRLRAGQARVWNESNDTKREESVMR